MHQSILLIGMPRPVPRNSGPPRTDCSTLVALAPTHSRAPIAVPSGEMPGSTATIRVARSSSSTSGGWSPAPSASRSSGTNTPTSLTSAGKRTATTPVRVSPADVSASTVSRNHTGSGSSGSPAVSASTVDSCHSTDGVGGAVAPPGQGVAAAFGIAVSATSSAGTTPIDSRPPASASRAAATPASSSAAIAIHTMPSSDIVETSSTSPPGLLGSAAAKTVR